MYQHPLFLTVSLLLFATTEYNMGLGPSHAVNGLYKMSGDYRRIMQICIYQQSFYYQ